ncbi:phospho-sugar mutase [Butyrivibrio sp. XPD2006]|uniref:phospho-sugar mutase n=1 Tax=Butyrivibrio sp. XPD2006 TaxID=1280668 RepID=UPI0003B36A23|nr:phospho-sugar mutase [Butyrivibrio sp. XPD2006]
MKRDYRDEFGKWKEASLLDDDLVAELNVMEENEAEMEDAFYKDLAFGTGGLRGVIGAGTNRMNVHTVIKASKGIADYLNDEFGDEKKSIAISFDSRIKSELFAKTAAKVFAGCGIDVYIYKELMPTPCLSFAVRKLGCKAGVMITASHNPAKYNGYKVYGSDGCQITTEAAEKIQGYIDEADALDVRMVSEHDERISFVPDEVYESFINEVLGLSLIGEEDGDKSAKIVYTPLNGTGRKPVTDVLKRAGFVDVHIVKEQENPDGNFPTCPYPNPEIPEAMRLGMNYAEEIGADILLATDPDCDRVGVAVRDKEDFVLLTGNQVGCLLLNYVCERRISMGTMPKNPVMVKTIVTSDLGEKIADHYGVKTINVLTGFKFIGEQIGLLETQGRKDDYVFGFEESCGYLSGTHARDKDGVNASLLICEMFAYYRKMGKSLADVLNELYERYGYYLNTLYSFEFEGPKGQEKMKNIMEKFRNLKGELCDQKVIKTLDYLEGVDDLPKSDVLKFSLETGAGIVVRPSGTEPKIKIYLSVPGDDRAGAQKAEKDLAVLIEKTITAVV